MDSGGRKPISRGTALEAELSYAILSWIIITLKCYQEHFEWQWKLLFIEWCKKAASDYRTNYIIVKLKTSRNKNPDGLLKPFNQLFDGSKKFIVGKQSIQRILQIMIGYPDH